MMVISFVIAEIGYAISQTGTKISLENPTDPDTLSLTVNQPVDELCFFEVGFLLLTK
jgi:hypothetical protein